VSQLEIAAERMEAVAGLADVLAAAYAVFMTMLPVIHDRQDPASPLFDMFVMAGAIAATGRLALLAAPSLPSSSRSASPAGYQSCGEPAEEPLWCEPREH
jgi:hypothetical protein